ncbi:unnamed protein product [Leptidea sinapis]|uniref:ZU5 domain-containing protein n=1 Tax=Leptidea sinapis TaxID=189913 RepID=A0A5E4R688_9NEOP|nr:unnamed protein product [Leptidea sinapis]
MSVTSLVKAPTTTSAVPHDGEWETYIWSHVIIAATRRAPAAAPPPLMEGEALASRLLELQPQGAKFLAPVIIEVPIFTASCPEREIVILRSDSGETWQDHYLHNNDNPMIQEALYRERQEHGPTGESLGENGERVTRIITCDFPHYLAVVSRIRQEVHIIGPEGGTISSAHIPQTWLAKQ